MSQGGSKFTRDAWAQYWGVSAFQPMPVGAFADPGEAAIHCEADACLLRPYNDRLGAMLARGAQHPGFCADVSVIVGAEPARGLCPKPWPKLVDRFTVWRYGSVAVWLDRDGARVLTDRGERGDRPWVAPLPAPKKAATPSLPVASTARDTPAARDEAPLPELPPRAEPSTGE
jgi:competence protein ComEC